MAHNDASRVAGNPSGFASTAREPLDSGSSVTPVAGTSQLRTAHQRVAETSAQPTRCRMLRLVPRPEASAEARAALRELCGHLGLDVVDTAVLLLAEIVTNAIKFARGTVDVSLTCTENKIRAEVADESKRLPVKKTPDLYAESGRGLHLVERLSTSWGVHETRGRPGKVVWFDLDVATASAG